MTLRSSEATSLLVCAVGCCEDPNAPDQPVYHAVIESTKQQIGNKNEFQCFNPTWCKEFLWIHLCTDRNKVFCYYCLSAFKKGLMRKTRRYETAFIIEGFQNWKKVTECFRRHEAAECHREAVLKLKSLHAPTVIEQLSRRQQEQEPSTEKCF